MKADTSKQFFGIRSIDQGAAYSIEALSKNKDENTLKISKSDQMSNEISYFQISTYRYLSLLLQDLKVFRVKRAYRDSQDLRKKIFPAINLIRNVRDFVYNRYLLASVKDKYNQRNKNRQDFLAQQQYILFCSMILADLLDEHELEIVEDLDEDDPQNAHMVEALNNKTDIEALMNSANLRYKASNKITPEEVMSNFIELIKAKVVLANQIYMLLKDITKHNSKNQKIALNNAVLYMHQFSALPFCSEFISYLICENEENSLSLSKNFNYSRIQNILPSIDRIKLDIILEDPNSLLTSNFPEIRESLIAEKITTDERRRMINPLIYCLTLLINSKKKKIKLKCLKFVCEISTINGQPSSITQEQIYKLILLVPELQKHLFTEFKM